MAFRSFKLPILTFVFWWAFFSFVEWDILWPSFQGAEGRFTAALFLLVIWAFLWTRAMLVNRDD